MKKRNQPTNRTRVGNGNRRRLMLKRVHQKVLVRRQHYQQQEMCEDITQAI